MASNALPYPVMIPCGGKSTRMGMPKGLMMVDGRPWLEVQLAHLQRAGIVRAIVILGFESEKYFRELAWAKSAASQWVDVCGVQVTVFQNPHPELGPFTSLQTGIHCVESMGGEAAFFLPMDVPCPDPLVWQSMVCECEGSAAAVIPSHARHGGHPVLLTRAFMLDLLKVPMDAPDARLDVQLRKQRHLAYVDVDDPKVGMNINTPEDLENLAL